MNINSISSANPISFKQTLPSSAANQIKAEAAKVFAIDDIKKEVLEELPVIAKQVNHYIDIATGPNTGAAFTIGIPNLAKLGTNPVNSSKIKTILEKVANSDKLKENVFWGDIKEELLVVAGKLDVNA